MNDDSGTPATPAVPEPPEDIREAARQAPDHWFGMVDPAWDEAEGPPPDWAVIGRWRSDATGEIVEWQENDTYRPSPAALGWAPPTDPADHAVQRAATGYGRPEDVVRALVGGELAVHVRPDGQVATAVTPEGTAVVPAFTAQPQVDAAGRLAYQVMPCRDVLGLLPPGHLLYLNPAGAVSLTVETQPLLDALSMAEDTV
ncbi:type VII secretion system-associated protein [Streptomyces dangxiongensis]|uniref:Type VII secretion system-associated protein n=1 Tax=Streptomyces dangxiongensis TaxID=1442032 RepID=A0A3G2JRB2_9ACTN|nr:type VII secretion system-associated protein [Streptomyces dangxiongensis]AYN43217.1 type VII secretion system-associated protein [Streptomyces dangxiongensis]